MILRFLLIPYRRGPSLLFFISSFGSVCVSLNREVLLSCYVLTSACFCCCSCSALLCVCRRVGFFLKVLAEPHTQRKKVYFLLFSVYFFRELNICLSTTAPNGFLLIFLSPSFAFLLQIILSVSLLFSYVTCFHFTDALE